ncbi:uncharacterized protein SCHCODRAFT_02041801 [Schizophyllum commune H4-8]|uniref:uncharacterized protein n=1 Tax=Schizophyllum commune (strain H4-8 / FGSC 9210) TaxID=578458 RepID=UPI00215E17CB|nr:uncharacterized protein SCHCODRAFT_02041801 [Schizophyllum commune H4-8]KAI5900667.1 hypothetical protein SCHCODRAFT_02041801 [Schizophyllum commune H4-8]
MSVAGRMTFAPQSLPPRQGHSHSYPAESPGTCPSSSLRATRSPPSQPLHSIPSDLAATFVLFEAVSSLAPAHHAAHPAALVTRIACSPPARLLPSSIARASVRREHQGNRPLAAIIGGRLLASPAPTRRFLGCLPLCFSSVLQAGARGPARATGTGCWRVCNSSLAPSSPRLSSLAFLTPPPLSTLPPRLLDLPRAPTISRPRGVSLVLARS